MFAALLNGPIIAPTAIVLGSWLAYLAISVALKTRRIEKTGCVRAPIAATNPVTAIPFFVAAAYKHSTNRLLDYFNGAINGWSNSSNPHCVELSFYPSRRYILTREPEHIKTVLTGKFAEFGKGPLFHEVWSPFLGDSIFTTDGHQWQNSRSLIRPVFVKERVRDLDIFDRWTDKMMTKIPRDGGTVDICDLFYRLTLDVTTEYLLGHSVNSLDNPKNHFSSAFQDVQRMQTMLTILSPARYLIPTGSYRRGIKILESFISPFIHDAVSLPPSTLEKLSASDKEFTFLHQLVAFSRDPKFLRDQIMAVLLAGRDTTAATLSWLLYHLAARPDVFAALRAEVLACLGPRRGPSYDDLKNLAEVRHAINETLRLYPAVPFNLRAALADTSLPSAVPGQPDIGVMKDDVVVYSTLAMQRRADLYPVGVGFPDPAVWEPGRWKGWTPKHWNYVPFNGGPRICVGQNFAMTEMAFVLVRLLQKYERLEYRGDWDAQVLKAEIVGAPGHGVPVALYEAAA